MDDVDAARAWLLFARTIEKMYGGTVVSPRTAAQVRGGGGSMNFWGT